MQVRNIAKSKESQGQIEKWIFFGKKLSYKHLVQVKGLLLLLDKFAIDVELLDIGNRDNILSLSLLIENRFMVDTYDRCLKNVNTSQVVSCSPKWIPEVLIMEDGTLEDGKILLIIDASERYSRYP